MLHIQFQGGVNRNIPEVKETDGKLPKVGEIFPQGRGSSSPRWVKHLKVGEKSHNFYCIFFAESPSLSNLESVAQLTDEAFLLRSELV